MREKVLITGASGFLGFHLINAAIENNLEVYAGVRGKSDIKHLQELPIQFVELNFSDTEGLYNLFSEHHLPLFSKLLASFLSLILRGLHWRKLFSNEG